MMFPVVPLVVRDNVHVTTSPSSSSACTSVAPIALPRRNNSLLSAFAISNNNKVDYDNNDDDDEGPMRPRASSTGDCPAVGASSSKPDAAAGSVASSEGVQIQKAFDGSANGVGKTKSLQTTPVTGRCRTGDWMRRVSTVLSLRSQRRAALVIMAGKVCTYYCPHLGLLMLYVLGELFTSWRHELNRGHWKDKSALSQLLSKPPAAAGWNNCLYNYNHAPRSLQQSRAYYNARMRFLLTVR